MQGALSGPADQIVDAITMGVIGTIALGFALLAGWMRRKFSGPVQEREMMAAAVDTELWAQAQVMAGREKPPSAVKEQRTRENARAAMPRKHRPIFGDARLVERVLPAARVEAKRRMSSPPPKAP